VLLATYSRTLRDSLTDNLIKLAGREILEYVDVQTIDGAAHRVLLAEADDPAKVRTAAVLSDTSSRVLGYWHDASAAAPRSWHPGFLAAEWTQVVLANDVRDRQEYLTVSCAGRGKRLSRTDRAELWEIFKRFELILEQERCLTFTQIAALAAAMPARSRYDHAVVDEAQDLHPAHWRLLRNVARQLFLVRRRPPTDLLRAVQSVPARDRPNDPGMP
jgi:superfamily I DNA/RNA helicase